MKLIFSEQFSIFKSYLVYCEYAMVVVVQESVHVYQFVENIYKQLIISPYCSLFEFF